MKIIGDRNVLFFYYTLDNNISNEYEMAHVTSKISTHGYNP